MGKIGRPPKGLRKFNRSISLFDEDEALLTEIMNKENIHNFSEVIRLSIRALHSQVCTDVPEISKEKAIHTDIATFSMFVDAYKSIRAVQHPMSPEAFKRMQLNYIQNSADTKSIFENMDTNEIHEYMEKNYFVEW